METISDYFKIFGIFQTFVNFTVTRSSLQSQCLNQVLKAERPDIDEKRSDLLKLQGEFHLRLRQLEKSLLQALNDAKGKILDDDSVITTLETLKKEAADIGMKVEETDKVIAEIETVSHQYLPLSTACSNIYFTMDSLNQIHFLYQYSLKMFLDIFSTVLYNNPNLTGKTDYALRLQNITKVLTPFTDYLYIYSINRGSENNDIFHSQDLFSVCYDRVARGMLHNDRLTFAILLCRIHLKGTTEQNLDAEFSFFLRNRDGLLSNQEQIEGFTSEQLEGVYRLSNRLPVFKTLVAKIRSMPDLIQWLQQSSPEQCVRV